MLSTAIFVRTTDRHTSNTTKKKNGCTRGDRSKSNSNASKNVQSNNIYNEAHMQQQQREREILLPGPKSLASAMLDDPVTKKVVQVESLMGIVEGLLAAANALEALADHVDSQSRPEYPETIDNEEYDDDENIDDVEKEDNQDSWKGCKDSGGLRLGRQRSRQQRCVPQNDRRRGLDQSTQVSQHVAPAASSRSQGLSALAVEAQSMNNQTQGRDQPQERERVMRPRPRSASARVLRSRGSAVERGIAIMNSTATAAAHMQGALQHRHQIRLHSRVTAGNLLLSSAARQANLSDDYLDALIEQHAPMLSQHTESTRTYRPRFLSMSAWNASLARGDRTLLGSERMRAFLQEAMEPNSDTSATASKGLDARKLDLLSSYELVKALDTGCCICLEDLEEGNLATVLPCSHAYHQGCIRQWLQGHTTCPLCKCEVEPPEK